MSKLYQIINWAKANGEVKAVDRIRMKVLMLTMKEKIALATVTKDTECSPELLQAIWKAANEVVGKSCPVKV